jgi:hypothetical protein
MKTKKRYLKTRKGQFYKLMKNGKKKRISQREYKKKKTRKNIKMIGGNLSEINSLDVSKKTIILIGEFHTDKRDQLQYFNIIRKQKEIINLGIHKFGKDKTYFYSEAPEEFIRQVLETDNYSSSVIAQYAKTKIPIKLSSITSCDRDESECDDKYCDDILSIFDNNLEINCIIVAIGLLHIPELKKVIISRRPDIKIIIVNTVSEKQLNPLIPEIQKQFPSVIDLLTIEEPYDLSEPQLKEEFSTLSPSTTSPSNETFDVEVLYNAAGKKIYKCPACNTVTGYGAPEDPYDTSLFAHKLTCPNKGKIPVEPTI